MSVRPICILCGVALKHETDIDKDGNEIVIEKHTEISIHNPCNLHEDIKIPAHAECYKKTKEVFPTFDMPTQADLKEPKIPFIMPDKSVVMVKLTIDLITSKETP